MLRSSIKNYLFLGKTVLLNTLIFVMLSAARFASAIEIENPIKARSFTDLIQTLTVAIRAIAIPLAVVAIIFAGFKFITGAVSGDTKAITEAKKMLTWIVIGTAIVVGSSVIADVIINTFGKTF